MPEQDTDSANLLIDQPLLLNEPVNVLRDAPDESHMKAALFAAKWTGYEGTEPQYYQAHFNELCAIVGHPTPSEDLTNTDFGFQKPAPTPGDHYGVADVFLREHFVMEYKKRGKIWIRHISKP